LAPIWLPAPLLASSKSAAGLSSRIIGQTLSYAAGITCLSSARFALATFPGVIPISFALAAMGRASWMAGRTGMWIVILGGAVGSPTKSGYDEVGVAREV